MPRYVAVLGAIQLELAHEVPDLEGFLATWGTGLSRGGEEILSPEAEARLVDLLPRFGRQLTEWRGSPAVNFAYALNRLDIPVRLLGRLGTDRYGDTLMKGLTAVDLSHLARGGESSRVYLLQDPEGGSTRLTAPHADNRLSLADIPLEVAANAAFLYFTGFAGEEPHKVQRQVAARLAGRMRLIFEPGERRARRGRQALEEILEHTETLLVGEAVWRQWGGKLKSHPDWAPPVVLIKRGHQGCRLLTPVRYLDFPPYLPSNYRDTWGVEAVFAAGYTAGLFLGLNLPQAIRLACALAAYRAADPARERYPDRGVLDTVVASLR
jgi:sugar/nucleoside kinase (ribokinase family)